MPIKWSLVIDYLGQWSLCNPLLRDALQVLSRKVILSMCRSRPSFSGWRMV